MKIHLLVLLLACCVVNATAQSYQQVDIRINQWHSTKAMLQLPDDYASGNKRYPLIMFLHGKSRSGTDLSKLTADGMPYWMHRGTKFQAVNPVDGKSYKFIVLCPQAPEWGFNPDELMRIMDQAIERYRVDTNRIYLTGYSAGGWTAVMTLTQAAAYAQRIAAAVPMSPQSIEPQNVRRFKNAADAGVHCWFFGGSDELHYLENVQQYADSINHYQPGLARITVTANRHCCWQEFYDPAFKQDGMNIYEWMLQYTRKD